MITWVFLVMIEGFKKVKAPFAQESSPEELHSTYEDSYRSKYLLQ